MTRAPKGHIRRRGNRYEVAVPLGRDPITKRYRYAYEYADTEAEASSKRDQLVARVVAGREPGAKATVNMLLDRWLAIADLEVTTLGGYDWRIRRIVRPVLGDLPLRKLQDRVDILDDLYAHLRRCSKLCDGRTFVEKHAAAGPHDCVEERCLRHECRPSRPRTIRQTHAILRRAFGYAVKWGWMERNPAEHATLPKLDSTEIEPPAPDEAARLITAAEAFSPDFGVFVWLAMVTGARRAELCVLRWPDIRFEEQDLLIARAYVVRGGHKVVKDTKTHQKRRLALDAATVELVKEHRRRCEQLGEQAGVSFRGDGYVFSRDGFGEEPWLPDTVSHQFSRLAHQAGARCRLHDLRHYSATQMLAAGVDLRTVAGRLGHSGGGSTTLRVYSHWTRPADQHAAELLARQLRRPGGGDQS